jgi:CspA family cold shock protein
MTSSSVTHTTSSSSERLFGRVKWFNNKTGYGFITVTDGPQSGTDIFAHHSSIGVVNQQQYKYLVEGEYVEFSISATSSGTHEFQATNVTGLKGGKLMCETRNENKLSRNNYNGNTDTPRPVLSVRGEGPRGKPPSSRVSTTTSTASNTVSDKKEWTLVKGAPAPAPVKSGRGRGRPPRSATTSV